MNYYRNYRCELTFDSVTGQLRIESDMEASPILERLLNRENLINTSFTNYSTIKSVDYRVHYGEPETFTTKNICSDIGIKQDPYLNESLSDSDLCSENSSYTTCNSPIEERSLACAPLRSPFGTPELGDRDNTPTTSSTDKTTAAGEKAGQYFMIRTLLDELQQLPCKALVKALLRVAIPAKKIRYPYKDGEKSRPEFWPANVPHRQPDHMSKTHRIDLIYFLMTEMALDDVIEVCNEFIHKLPDTKQRIVANVVAALGHQPKLLQC